MAASVPRALATDLRIESVAAVVLRVEMALGVHLDRDTAVRKRRTIGARTDRDTWVRIERRPLAKIDEQGWNGLESAALLEGALG